MAKHRHVLALGFGEDFDSLADRLRLLKFRAVRAKLAEDGLRALERGGESIRAVLVSVPYRLGDLKFALHRLRDHAPTPSLRFVAIGPRPSPGELEELREADVEFGLWQPFDDAALRFVLNQALHDHRSGESRNVLRVPTTLVARVFSAAGAKEARVYNLSETGAFLETHRPTPAKGHVRVELQLRGGTLALEARVQTTNVPGNIQKANMPMGMGVEFLNVGEDARQALAVQVEAMADRFRIDGQDASQG